MESHPKGMLYIVRNIDTYMQFVSLLDERKESYETLEKAIGKHCSIELGSLCNIICLIWKPLETSTYDIFLEIS